MSHVQTVMSKKLKDNYTRMFAIGSSTINKTYTVQRIETKSFLFASNRKIKIARKLNIKYKNVKVKTYSRVTYVGCVLDETFSGEPIS